MRVVFFSKRQYMRKDVLDDRYGRLFELPRQMARRGHKVLGICLSYQARTEGRFAMEENLNWYSYNLGRWMFPGFLRYMNRVKALLREFCPDYLIGASDTPHVVLTAYLARRFGLPYVVDLYDNFESFGLSRLPGLPRLYHRALRNASGITCVSSPLADYIRATHEPSGPVITLESVVDVKTFHPLDRESCRRQLGLPPGEKLIGVAGALDEGRGMDNVYRAFHALEDSGVKTSLVLAGKASKNCPVPQHKDIHFLGALPHEQMPLFFNALDIAIIPMRDTAFGRYAFPQKLYEILACRIPLVAASVGAMREVLAEYPESLYSPENPEEMSARLVSQLLNPVSPCLPIPTWEAEVGLLETLLKGLPKAPGWLGCGTNKP